MANLDTLTAFFEEGSTLVLTGAGISEASGIPTYRDHSGKWKRSNPIQHQEFISNPYKRQRYWARSMVGWRPVEKARPNLAHSSLARLEKAGLIDRVVTQNVDRLHSEAGAKDVIDLHGRLDRVICLNCGDQTDRQSLQPRLEEANPSLVGFIADLLPDGDADIDDYPMETVRVPSCLKCHGILKPDVVFFGDNVPKERKESAMEALQQAKRLLTIGTSLQVYSGFRFCRRAADLNMPIGCINKGVTRADSLLQYKWQDDCSILLSQVADRLCA